MFKIFYCLLVILALLVVVELVAHNRELVGRKVPQGFDRLELTPMAMPTPLLIDRMKATILTYAAKGTMYQTRRSASDPLIPVRVNSEKHVWIWDTLRQALDTDELVYFPQEYSSNHRGQTKLAVVNNGRMCAVPGWSVSTISAYMQTTRATNLTLGFTVMFCCSDPP